MNNIILKIIGYVESSVKEQKDEQWGKVDARVVLQQEYRKGLQGIEQFSHALIVTFLHEALFDPSKHLVRRPRGLDTMPEVGIFAQRAKDRPNPIGITAVSIVRVEYGALIVRGLDAIDGTPVVDVKPYYPAYDRMINATVPEWVDRLMKGYF
ncbi:MAG: tRNA (N6-threonylcarbamoyladenosine(37)-N6)-methyltransferase TrmO [Nitrospirae bacterium]|nr:tRNA (N6-threonylcarbamoyladenosine(37)-N6)-methyltransferase TrmO [Nitrospirota bacterium]